MHLICYDAISNSQSQQIMKKSLFWSLIVAALLAFYIAATWYTGKAGEDRVRATIADINAQASEQFQSDAGAPQITITNYDRGIFSSVISYQLEYFDPESKKHTAEIIANLSHGPLPWAAITNGIYQPMLAFSQLKPVDQGAWGKWFDLMPANSLPWLLTSKFAFNGDINSDLKLNGFAKEQEIKFSGANFDVAYTAENKDINITGQMANLVVHDAAANAVYDINNLSFLSSNTHQSANQSKLRQEIKIESIDLDLTDKTTINFANANAVLETTKTDGILNTAIIYNLGDISKDKQTIGNLKTSFSVKNINIAAAQGLIDVLKDIDPDKDIADFSSVEQEKVIQALVKIFESAPIIALDNMQFTTPKGNTNLSTVFTFKPIKTKNTDGMGTLLEEGIDNIKFKLNISKPMIKDILNSIVSPDAREFTAMYLDFQLSRLERLGLTVNQKDTATSDILYQDGIITLNGERMLPSYFARRLMSAPVQF